eukprot:758786-Hanusia_phi.AAC.1
MSQAEIAQPSHDHLPPSSSAQLCAQHTTSSNRLYSVARHAEAEAQACLRWSQDPRRRPFALEDLERATFAQPMSSAHTTGSQQPVGGSGNQTIIVIFTGLAVTRLRHMLTPARSPDLPVALVVQYNNWLKSSSINPRVKRCSCRSKQSAVYNDVCEMIESRYISCLAIASARKFTLPFD